MPGRPQSALLLVDFINAFDYPGGARLVRPALKAARASARLAARARKARVPVVYVNDNFGRWRDDFRAVVSHVEQASPAAAALVSAIRPEDDDYFVLKPRNSGFFHTPLEILLQELGIRRLVLAGLTTDNCVLFTANDAHLRGYEVVIASDCMASIRAADHATALKHLRAIDDAAVRTSASIRWR